MKIYTKSMSFIVLIALTVLAHPVASQAFRCGTSLITEGDTKAEVAQECGEPDYVDSWEEERIARDFSSGRVVDPRTRSFERNRIPFLVKKTVKIEVWTYHLGPTHFTRYLTFENGILVDITTGEKK